MNLKYKNNLKNVIKIMSYLSFITIAQVKRQVVLNVVGKLRLIFRIESQHVDKTTEVNAL